MDWGRGPLFSSYPDDKNPFDEGQTEAGDGSISTGGRWCQTKWQEEANPVEEERHWWGEKRGGIKTKLQFTSKSFQIKSTEMYL